MTFEKRRSPFLAFQCYAPNPPNDITPSQVQNYVAENNDVKVVQLSGGWMDRPKAGQDNWRQLDADLSEAGIDVYFGFGGTCTWEAGFSDGRPPGVARRPFTSALGAGAHPEGAIPIHMGSHAGRATPGDVSPGTEDRPSPFVQSDPEYQLPMFDLDGSALIDTTGPDDDGAALAPHDPIGGVTAGSTTDGYRTLCYIENRSLQLNSTRPKWRTKSGKLLPGPASAVTERSPPQC